MASVKGDFKNPTTWAKLGHQLREGGFSDKPTKHRPKDPPADWFATMRARRRLP